MNVSVPVRVRYVTFLFPGALHPEERPEEIGHNDPDRVVVPDGAYGFKFHSVLRVTVTDGTERVELSSEKRPEPNRYYVGGTVYTMDEVSVRFPQSLGLITYMKENGIDRAIRHARGHWDLFRDGVDRLVVQCPLLTNLARRAPPPQR